MTREESYRRVQRRDSLICIALCCAVLLGVLLAVPLMAQGEAAKSEISATYVCVQNGDSLWSIGSQYCGSRLSVADCVEWIIQHNGLTSSMIVPGQIIEVPAA